MEVAKRLMYGRIVPVWLAFAGVLSDFFEEAIFRLALTLDVLLGRVPLKTEKRAWLRSRETPALVDVYDWTTDRLLFSVLVLPSLE